MGEQKEWMEVREGEVTEAKMASHLAVIGGKTMKMASLMDITYELRLCVVLGSPLLNYMCCTLDAFLVLNSAESFFLVVGEVIIVEV